MSDLIVAVFDDLPKAEEVRLDLMKMEKDELADLEDAVVLIRKKGGEIKLHHATHITFSGAVTGGFLGSLFGVILLNPVFAIMGLAAGTAIGAVSGSMTHLGIDEDFMRELATHLRPGSSALCILARENTDAILKELESFTCKVLRTTFSEENEEKVKKELETVRDKVCK
ncbi:MAG: DUF1269 domain-containing protein [Desulfoferrobacter sp.]